METDCKQISPQKRAFDVLLAGLGLVVAAPVMLVISAALWLESPGHVLFAQKRLGQGGKTFNLFKFRKFPHTWGDTGPGVTLAGDVRMTTLGRFLEKTKLDELPQLWNILRGDMSVVGPRPESCRYESLFAGPWIEVLHYRPGIFGPNQVAYRNEAQMYPLDRDPEEFYAEVLFPAKAKNDIEYFREANLASDFSWMIRSLVATFAGMVHIPAWLQRSVHRIVGDVIFCWLAIFITQSGNGLFALASPLLLVASLLVFGCYRYPAHRVGFKDAVQLGWACGVFASIYGWKTGLQPLPCLNLALVSFALALFPRGLSRTYMTGRSIGPKIVVVGANAAGRALAVFIEFSQQYQLVGFVDENRSLKDTRIHGKPILGVPKDLPLLIQRHQIEQVWVTGDFDQAALEALNDLVQDRQVSIHQPLNVS